MKKLLIIVGLFIASSATAMEQAGSALSVFTTKETQSFKTHLAMAVISCKKKIEEKKYSDKNAVCAILFQLSDELKRHDNDVVKMLNADQDLMKNVNIYKSVDVNPVIEPMLNQVRNNEGNVDETKKLIIEKRRMLSELKLKEIEPAYSPSLAGASQPSAKEKKTFVEINADYPMNDEAVIQYKALFIYLTLFADKVV